MTSIYVIFLKKLYNLLFFLYFLLPENIYIINQNSKTRDEFCSDKLSLRWIVIVNLYLCFSVEKLEG
jgi:hypothetical protein